MYWFKVPAGTAVCTACFNPDLRTNGLRVHCKCRAETDVLQWGKELRKFARKVRIQLEKLQPEQYREAA